MAVYAPLPGGPVSDSWAFSGQGSGQQVPGTPDQTWQWNLAPSPEPGLARGRPALVRDRVRLGAEPEDGIV